MESFWVMPVVVAVVCKTTRKMFACVVADVLFVPMINWKVGDWMVP